MLRLRAADDPGRWRARYGRRRNASDASIPGVSASVAVHDATLAPSRSRSSTLDTSVLLPTSSASATARISSLPAPPPSKAPRQFDASPAPVADAPAIVKGAGTSNKPKGPKSKTSIVLPVAHARATRSRTKAEAQQNLAGKPHQLFVC